MFFWYEGKAGEGGKQRLVEEEQEVKKMSLLEDIEQELLNYRKEGDTEDRSGGFLWKARKERIKDPSHESKDMIHNCFRSCWLCLINEYKLFFNESLAKSSVINQ